jgi:hypothetical protein
MQFCGTYQELQALVASIASPGGSWRDLNNHEQFRAHDCAILNSWQPTGTVNFQGSRQMTEELEAAFIAANGPKPETIHGLKEENARLKKLLDDVMDENERLKANAAPVAAKVNAEERGAVDDLTLGLAGSCSLAPVSIGNSGGRSTTQANPSGVLGGPEGSDVDRLLRCFGWGSPGARKWTAGELGISR